MDKRTNQPVRVRLSKDAGVTNPEKLNVYVVDSSGKVIEEAPFKGYDVALKTPKQVLHAGGKLYIGAAFSKEAGIRQLTERHLLKSKAFEVGLQFNRENIVELIKVPRGIDIDFFPFRFCHITGHLNKFFNIDGQNKKHAVCHARVSIYEVDRFHFVLPNIPDYVVVDIRDWFRKTLREKVQLEIQPPIPPRPIVRAATPVIKDNLPLRLLKANQKLSNELKLKALPALPDEVQASLLSDSLQVVQSAIAANYRILYPYFCLYPLYHHWFYSKQLINTVESDCNGKFDTWYLILDNDQPDVYIKVEVLHEGNWVTVYDPGLPCGTRWDYACGTDINITLTDPRVAPCSCTPLEGDIVYVRRVGNGTSIRKIALHEASAQTPSPFSDVRGLTNNTGVEGNNYVSPFTQAFDFYVKFGDGFPNATTTHYRWKYRRITNQDLGDLPLGDFDFQQGPLSKAYTYPGDFMGTEVFYTGLFTMDQTVGSGKIYKIPNADAVVATGVAGARWETDDTASIRVNASGLPGGLYEFVMELTDSAGNTQAVSESVFQVDSLMASPPNPQSIPALSVDPEYLVRNLVGNVIGFRFLLRIDNDATSCEIFDAIVRSDTGSGTTTDTICGFATYNHLSPGQVLFRFDAHQPRNYAKYDFNVTKGNGTPGAAANVSGQVPEPSHIIIVNGVPANYQLSRTVANLLGSCTQAAFAENLYVTAYHTNGSERVHPYDSGDTAAFAIEPDA
ncbi:hypothetical protein [Paraflavitalea sp. CAU 1676]|uniref:hypothetical protein n=1 Tax=Paraflavitalea sp. CAU 1676 TaxID=3032598 RepID=UPI0023DB3786|nr:hypothetical protein [Paraflavitalea sp. CAU 1676]MDF2187571.1 hypothetical protein [Paraflavitalea sp. CAU 1676]